MFSFPTFSKRFLIEPVTLIGSEQTFAWCADLLSFAVSCSSFVCSKGGEDSSCTFRTHGLLTFQMFVVGFLVFLACQIVTKAMTVIEEEKFIFQLFL